MARLGYDETQKTYVYTTDSSAWTTTGVTAGEEWSFYYPTTKETDTEKEKQVMKFKKHEEMRERIADAIAGALEMQPNMPDLSIRILHEEDNRSGPMGGKSSQIVIIADDHTDGGLVGVAINVYSDDKIDGVARDYIDALEKEAEDRANIFPAGDA